MAEIGRVQTTRIPWPTTPHAIKPTGEQQRQPDKQHKQKDDEREPRDDDDGFNHIDEYA